MTSLVQYTIYGTLPRVYRKTQVSRCFVPKMAYFWPMKVLKPSQLKANAGAILDKAIRSPQYVERGGTLLVIKKAEFQPAQDDSILSPWELRSKVVESFYDPAKAW